MNPVRVWFNKNFSGTVNLVEALRGTGLREAGPPILSLASHTSPDAPALAAADEAFLEPRGLTGSAYVDWCLETCEARGVTLLVPGKETAALASARDRFSASGVRLLTAAGPDTLALLEDKARFYETFDRAIAPVLDFRLVDTPAGFEAAVAELGESGPVCFKPNVGIYGNGFRALADDDRDLARLLDGEALTVSLGLARSLFATRERFRPLLVMRFAGGVERSIDCLARSGELVRAVVRRKDDGAQQLEENPPALALARRVAAAYRLSGLFNVQTRDLDGQAHILEVNARPSGGLVVAMASGLNFPLWAVRLALGACAPADVPAPTTGARVAQVTRAMVVREPAGRAGGPG